MKAERWARAPMAAACALSLGLATLAGCDGAPSATAARQHTAGVGADRRLVDSAPEGGDGAAQGARYGAAAYGSGEPRRDAATPLYKGKPIWSANRNHSAEENADYHFKRDGDAVGATSEEDFIAKVHAFLDNPPKGVETLSRGNGDKLYYDPRANLFAVADKDGVPRTLFKPKDGPAYWAQQKQAIADGETAFRSPNRRSARRSQADDNG